MAVPHGRQDLSSWPGIGPTPSCGGSTVLAIGPRGTFLGVFLYLPSISALPHEWRGLSDKAVPTPVPAEKEVELLLYTVS